MTSPEYPPVSPADVLRSITNAIDAGLAAPMSVHLFTPAVIPTYHGRALQIRLGDNSADDLPGWAEWLGLGAPAPTEGEPHTGRTDKPAWRSHRAEGEWQGWRADVWSAVDEPTDADRTCSQCEEDLESDQHHCPDTGECVDLCECPEHVEDDDTAGGAE